MYLDGKVQILGKLNVTDIKKSLLELSEMVWAQDSRRKVNKNFSDCHSLWLQNHTETLDNFLHTINNINICENEEFKNSWVNLLNQVEKIIEAAKPKHPGPQPE